MEVGTKILLKRIEECPEEFASNGIHGISKWFNVLNAAKHCLPKEEFDAINGALETSRKKFELDRFNEDVLKTLAGEETSSETGLTYKSSERYSMATAAGTNALQNSYVTQGAQQAFGPVAAKQEGGLLSSLRGSSIW